MYQQVHGDTPSDVELALTWGTPVDLLDGANITDPVSGTFSLYWRTAGVVTVPAVLPSPSWGLAAALHPARPRSSLGRVAASRTHFGTVAGGRGDASEVLASTHLLLGSRAHGSVLASVQEASGRSQRVVGTGMLSVEASGGQEFSAYVGGDRGRVDGQPFGGGTVAVRADVRGDSTNTHVAWQGAQTQQLDDGSSLSRQEGSTAVQLETGEAAFTLGGAYDHRIWAETDGFDLERGLLGTGFARWDQEHDWFTLTTGLTHHAFADNPPPAPMGSLMLHGFDRSVHLFVGGGRRWSVGRWLPPSLIDAAGAAHSDTLRYGLNATSTTLSALAAVQHEVVQRPWVALLPSGAPVFGLDRVRGDLDRAERRRVFAEGSVSANTLNEVAYVDIHGWWALRSSGEDRLTDPTAAFVPDWVDGLRPGGASITGRRAWP